MAAMRNDSEPAPSPRRRGASSCPARSKASISMRPCRPRVARRCCSAADRTCEGRIIGTVNFVVDAVAERWWGMPQVRPSGRWWSSRRGTRMDRCCWLLSVRCSCTAGAAGVDAVFDGPFRSGDVYRLYERRGFVWRSRDAVPLREPTASSDEVDFVGSAQPPRPLRRRRDASRQYWTGTAKPNQGVTSACPSTHRKTAMHKRTRPSPDRPPPAGRGPDQSCPTTRSMRTGEHLVGARRGHQRPAPVHALRARGMVHRARSSAPPTTWF